ncbi:MAG: hypothetical protein U0871_17035 [Gemmataceae bacterium]
MPAAAVRRDEWADAVFDAVRTLRAALVDPASSLKAAVELLKLEVARIRHGRPIAGTSDRDVGAESPLSIADMVGDSLGGGRGSCRAVSPRQPVHPLSVAVTGEASGRCHALPGSAGASPSPRPAHRPFQTATTSACR